MGYSLAMALRNPPEAEDSVIEQTEVEFPARRSNTAHEIDQEFIAALQQMLDIDESVTAWAVTRRMHSVRQASSLTRDAWRMARIQQAQRQQLQIRTSADRHVSADVTRDLPSRLRISPDIDTINSFVTVARMGTLGGAARALKISQPTLSQHVRRLEGWLGIQLLLRHGRGVTLTAAGSRFFARAEAAMHLLTAPAEKVRASTVVPNNLTLALPSGVGSLLAPEVLTEFRVRQPEVMLKVREGAACDIEEWLVNGQIDSAVLEDPPNIPGIDMEAILTQSIGLVTTPRLALHGDPRQLALRDLLGRPLILLDQRHLVTRQIVRASLQYGVHLSQVAEANSIHLVKAMVRQGLGHAVLPYLVALEEILQGKLLFYPIRRPLLATRYFLASRSQMDHVELASIIRHKLMVVAGRVDQPEAEILGFRETKSEASSSGI